MSAWCDSECLLDAMGMNKMEHEKASKQLLYAQDRLVEA